MLSEYSEDQNDKDNKTLLENLIKQARNNVTKNVAGHQKQLTSIEPKINTQKTNSP